MSLPFNAQLIKFSKEVTIYKTSMSLGHGKVITYSIWISVGVLKARERNFSPSNFFCHLVSSLGPTRPKVSCDYCTVLYNKLLPEAKCIIKSLARPNQDKRCNMINCCTDVRNKVLFSVWLSPFSNLRYIE